MSDKKLAILGIVAVLAVGAAILQHRLGQTTRTADFSSSTLIEGLNIDSIAAINITSDKGSKTLKLVRKDDKFVIPDKDGYPADAGKINDLINKCLDIRVDEKITSNPDNHADLNVTPDTAKYVIAFLNSDEKPIVTLLLSDTDPDTHMAHARLLSGNDVYAVEDVPWFNTAATDYMDTQLLSVQRDKINSVAVKTPADSYVLSSPQDSDEVRLEKMPEGKQYKGTTYKTVFGALSGLRFDDVTSPDNAPADLNYDYTYTCKLYDLTVYKLSIAKKNDKTYLKISADFLDKTPVEKTVGQVESDEELKKKEAKLLAIDAVKDFNAAHKQWVYQIPSYQAGNLTKTLSDLIEDKPQPAKSTPAEPNSLKMPTPVSASTDKTSEE